MNQNIYIVGAGAIGKALAVFMKEENKKVLLIRGSVDDEPAEKSRISVRNQDGQLFQQEVITTTFSNLSSIDGIVLIATKTFSNTEIAQKLSGKKGKFSIVLLQNGLNIEAPFQDFKEVYRCVLFSTSQVLPENNISFKTVTASPVGRIANNKTQTEEIVGQINTAQFGFRSEANIEKFVWDKVIVNCAFNSICPLLETDNGIFQRNKDAMRLAREIILECVSLAKEYGISLDKSDIEEKLLFISQKADGQLISTYEDIRKNRSTEIDSLNLEMARLADNMGKPDLTAKTKLLGELISIKSDIGINNITPVTHDGG